MSAKLVKFAIKSEADNVYLGFATDLSSGFRWFQTTTAVIDFLHRHNMFDKQSVFEKAPSAKASISGRRDRAGIYLVHAVVSESAVHDAEPDASLLQKLVRRRLVRLERVVAALSGKLIRQMPFGLLAGFESAEAAVLGACEMQRRCAVIPQIAQTQIALKIGIQYAATKSRSGDSVDPDEIAAIKFPSSLDEGCVLVSQAIVDELSPSLRQAASPVADAGFDGAAHTFKWEQLPMLRLPTPVAEKQPVASSRPLPGRASITFSLAGAQFSFGSHQPVITIGRDLANDIAVNDPKASRQHCKIIYQGDGYVLVDVSTNGSYMMADNGKQRIVRKALLSLPLSGRISLGHPSSQGDSSALQFEIKPAHA